MLSPRQSKKKRKKKVVSRGVKKETFFPTERLARTKVTARGTHFDTRQRLTKFVESPERLILRLPAEQGGKGETDKATNKKDKGQEKGDRRGMMPHAE